MRRRAKPAPSCNAESPASPSSCICPRSRSWCRSERRCSRGWWRISSRTLAARRAAPYASKSVRPAIARASPSTTTAPACRRNSARRSSAASTGGALRATEPGLGFLSQPPWRERAAARFAWRTGPAAGGASSPCFLSRVEAIANAAQRLDADAVLAELAAQPSDEDVDDVGRALEARTPDVLLDELPRKGDACVPHEKLQQIVLARREIERFAGGGGRARSNVDDDIAG